MRVKPLYCLNNPYFMLNKMICRMCIAGLSKICDNELHVVLECSEW